MVGERVKKRTEWKSVESEKSTRSKNESGARERKFRDGPVRLLGYSNDLRRLRKSIEHHFVNSLSSDSLVGACPACGASLAATLH